MLTQETHACPAAAPPGVCIENTRAVTSATPPCRASLTEDDTSVVRNWSVRTRPDPPSPGQPGGQLQRGDAAAIDTEPVTATSAATATTVADRVRLPQANRRGLRRLNGDSSCAAVSSSPRFINWSPQWCFDGPAGQSVPTTAAMPTVASAEPTTCAVGAVDERDVTDACGRRGPAVRSGAARRGSD